MDDLISRAAALDAISTDGGCGMCARRVLDIPAVDAVPVVNGRWMVTDAYPHNVYCSECYKTFAQTHWAVWEDGSLPRNCCPNCGARMDAKRRE